ncbi:MAG: hypothetical protein HFJ75_04965 [Eggerthellaceae bacterium]|nr:hypothetical protein [Eggerthellaceae bacterium]
MRRELREYQRAARRIELGTDAKRRIARALIQRRAAERTALRPSSLRQISERADREERPRDRHARRHWLVGAIPAAAVVAAIAIVVSSNAVVHTEVADGERRYQVNERGLTYFEDVEPSNNPEPGEDLFKVGFDDEETGEYRTGYVYSEELEAAERPPQSPEHAVILMQEKKEEASRAWQEAINDLVGDGALSIEQAGEIYDATHSSEGFRGAARTLASFPSVDLSEEEALTVLIKALGPVQEALTTWIPVYESDGVTRIGRFPVTNF